MARQQVAVLLLISALVSHAVYMPQNRKLLDAKSDTLHFTDGHHLCIKCPPGTHQSKACDTPGTEATCSPCTDGVDYTEYDNEMKHCLPCTRCKPGQEEASRCSTTRNTECRCKEGTFCPPDHPCEACLRCKTHCPDGEDFISLCNATANGQCAKPTEHPAVQDNQVLVWVILLVLLVFFIVAIILYCVCKKKLKSSIGGCLGLPSGSYTSAVQMLKRCHHNSRTQETRDNNANHSMDPAARPMLAHREGNEVVIQGLGNDHLQGQGAEGQPMDYRHPNGANMVSYTLIPVDKDEKQALLDAFHYFLDQEFFNQWKFFMRKLCLTDSEMEYITVDHTLEGLREARFQMLRKWHVKAGNAGSVNTLLQALHDIGLGNVSEDITQGLLKNNLYKLLPAS